MKAYHLAEGIIDEKDLAALGQWLQKNPKLTQGELTREFEERWAVWIGTKYAVFCNSGSSANLLMAYATLLRGALNKKVIVPSVGWATTISPFIQFGFEPIMCGADEENFGLDLNHLEKLIKAHRPSTVIFVTVLGVPGNIHDLLFLQNKYNFILLEDACAALGAEYDGKKVGSFSDMSSFSFYYGHQLSTIEGGMVNTNDKQSYDLLVMLRSHGWGKDLDGETRSHMMRMHGVDEFHEPFTFFVPGFNVRGDDLRAFLGLRMMAKADKITQIRRDNHYRYADNLRGVVEYQKWDLLGAPCSISFGALGKTQKQRKKIVGALNTREIETRLFSAGNLGLHPFWIERYGAFHHPMSDKVHQCGFFLPNNESIRKKDVDYICDIVKNACEEEK